MIDLINPDIIEIKVNKDINGLWTNIWINIDGECKLRIEGFKELYYESPGKQFTLYGISKSIQRRK